MNKAAQHWDRWTWNWVLLGVAVGAHVGAISAGIWSGVLALDQLGQPVPWLVLLIAGASGTLLACVSWHPRRSLGWLPWCYPLVTMVCWISWPEPQPLALGIFVFLTILIALSLLLHLAALAPRSLDALAAGFVSQIVVAKLLSARLLAVTEYPEKIRALLIVLGLTASLASWVVGYRVALERLLEGLIWPLYRIRAIGPGVRKIPLTGPLLVIANHTNMLDPLFLGKIIPRRVVPMMTSKYYDLPILSFLMRYVVGTIRVEDNRRKKEAPEIAEAVARLREGHCVMIFPEGRLKRHEEPVLNYFAQGIWHILREVPETPVVACWINGAWGAYLSYRNGPPGVGKPIDWWRPITVVVAQPIRVPPEVLETHQKTRRFLTDFVLALREQLPGHQIPATAPVEESEDDSSAVQAISANS
jgi:1-acyl-sn-glycerol-3-phosphate acyltransferase